MSTSDKPAYERVADALRSAIEAGDYPPGSVLPSASDIATLHDVKSQETALKALRLLEAEGHITIPRRQRAIVRQRPSTRTVVRDRHAYRDEVGYFFDQGAKDWRAIGTPTRGLQVPPRHVAELLNLPTDQDVLVRDRAIGPEGSKRALQLATSYIPVSLVAEIPALGAENSGPGGIYDRIEEHFGVAIRWREHISSRLPDADEQERLTIPATVPLLVVTRESMVARAGDHLVAEVNETRMSAELYSVSYNVIRDESAVWPREP